MGGVLKFVTCFQIFFLFLNKRSIFADGESWGGVTQLVIFCGRHKCMTPKWFKITTNSVIRGSSFFFNMNTPQTRFDCHREQPPAPPFPHFTDDQTKGAGIYFQLPFNFLCEKNCGLMNWNLAS